MNQRTTRRAFLAGLAGAASLLALAGCGGAAAPSSSAAAAGSPAAKASTASAASGASAGPVGSAASGAPKPAADWQAQWDKLVAAAKQEGTVAYASMEGNGYKEAIAEFTKAFGINVDHTQYATASVLGPKLKRERDAGVYSVDVVQAQPADALGVMRTFWDPLRPALIHADVLDDGKWNGGFEAGWLDNAKQLAYAYGEATSSLLALNTDMVAEGEVKTPQDMLNPKWKGKLVMADVTTGFTFSPSTGLRLRYGEDFLKKLIVDQQPTFIREGRQLVEAMVRGKYAIGFGLQSAILKDFTDEGQGKNVKMTDIPGLTTVVNQNAWLAKNALHPNAAKLLLNWILTKEGQTAWRKVVTVNSRRTDVPPVDPSVVPQSGRDYFHQNQESSLAEITKTRDLLSKWVS
ncbi:MAG TPA: extracellular solute-binding protein [Chloroflexota bacterium]|nr:extracellular solute-binding protein [Chloroflexota bacterium]